MKEDKFNINTKIFTMTEEQLEFDRKSQKELCTASEILLQGGLVAFPTETVYGIGANALSEEAIRKIYSAKGRPSDNPLIMHICSVEMMQPYVSGMKENIHKLIEAFWPGPLTLVFNKTDLVPKCITGGLDTVAIRMPNHMIARKIIELAGVPVAAPSANLSGKPSPTEGQHVIDDLMGRVDVIIDGGKVTLGLESTVLDVTGDIPCILRPGSITRTMIEQVIGPVTYDNHLKHKNAIPKSPGMKYKHYAPVGDLTIIISEDEEKIIQFIQRRGKELELQHKKVGVIAPSHIVNKISIGTVLDIGKYDDATMIGSNLFKILREFDDLNVDEIFSFEFKGEELMESIMNRLNKAAGYHKIDLDGDGYESNK